MEVGIQQPISMHTAQLSQSLVSTCQSPHLLTHTLDTKSENSGIVKHHKVFKDPRKVGSSLVVTSLIESILVEVQRAADKRQEMLGSVFSDKDYLNQEFLEESKALKHTSSKKEPDTYKRERVQVIYFELQ